jgi:hypothetical protein
MGFKLSLKDIGNFATGAIERDKQITKENLAIRADELKANRDLMIAMKKDKYASDINEYKKERAKANEINRLNAVAAAQPGGIDKKAYAQQYLLAVHGPENYKILQSNPENFNKMLNDITTPKDYKFTLDRNSIDKQMEADTTIINKGFADAIENAKGDSFLINKILKKKSNINENVNANIEEQLKAAKIIKEETVGDDIDLSKIKFKDSELYVPKIFKDSFEVDIKKAREIDYSSKEYNKKISDTVLTLIPKTKHKDFYTVDGKSGTLIAKPSIINADITVQALMNNSLKDINVNDIYISTNGDKSKIDLSTNTRYDKVKNHISEYGSWYADGKVLNGGSIKNLLKSTSTALVVPSNSIINLNNNKLKGYNITIDKSLRKDVGKVYKNFIDTTARKRMETVGGTLEQNINALQLELQNDNNGENKLTQDARTYIALALKDVKNADGELLYPSLTAKKEKALTAQSDNISTGKSTMDMKQEELSSADKEDFGNVRTITIKDKVTGNDTKVPLTTKNMNWLRKNYPEVNLAVDQDAMTGDSKIIETIAKETVKEKIKPVDMGIKNEPVFTTLESIKAILPNKMSGQEIMDKYEISFPINKFTTYSPSK